MKFQALEIVQGSKCFYAFTCAASVLWSFSEINQRQENKDEGYQRVLSPSRVKRLKEFILQGNAVPGAIIISCDNAKYTNNEIVIPKKHNAAWIIDGQHRCAGAFEASKNGRDINLAVVAFINLPEQEQAEYFVTINKEAKGVPSSLYIDLLRNLPRQKTDREHLEERIADISRELSRDEESVFFQRIVSTTSPSASQVSLTNFARRLRLVLHANTGILGAYTLPEQVRIVDNYFMAIKRVFPKEFQQNIFFKTLGFGAMWRAFPLVFTLSLKQSSGFRVQDVEMVLNSVAGFDFGAWQKLGTGSAAEIQAGDDLIAELSSPTVGGSRHVFDSSMSSFPKSARHPDVVALIDKWRVVADSINVEGDFRLSEFPEIARSADRLRNVEDLDYFGGAREIVGANAIRTLAKCYEALDASGECGQGGITMGALVQAYNASFFAARGFCMLMGFAPLDRGSAITLDAFFEETQRTKRTVRSTELLRLHKYKRWGHEEVWALSTRLIYTMEVPSNLKNVKKWLQTAECVSIR